MDCFDMHDVAREGICGDVFVDGGLWMRVSWLW